MEKSTDHLHQLLELLDLERQEERDQFRKRFLETALAERKARGWTWYPVVIANQEIGIGDRLVLEIERAAVEGQISLFKVGSVASLWSNAESQSKNPATISGVVIKSSREKLFLAMDDDDLPDWIDEGKLGLDLYYDERTIREMEKALKAVIAAERDRTAQLREILTGFRQAGVLRRDHAIAIPELNASQNEALDLVARAEDVAIIHGPPGTGKTTTLVRAIRHVLKSEKQVLVCAASNLATDLLTEKLSLAGVRVLRLGHPARVSEHVLKHSLDVQLAVHPSFQDMKALRKEAEKIRRQALKFKRRFGHEQRNQRRELLAEARACQREARDLEAFMLRDLVDKAEAVTCTLTGAATSMLEGRRFSTLFIDEAAQALEPACWIPIRKAERVVFAGDHCQLPPTVKSHAATKRGLAVSLFERCIELQDVDKMLRTQYRMHRDIMGFSNAQFYNGELQAHETVADALLGNEGMLGTAIQFVDTAGCGYEETQNPETLSRSNPGEADLLIRHLGQLLAELPKPNKEAPENSPRIGVISPYRDQVMYLEEAVTEAKPLWGWRHHISVDTVDGFQGQERDIIYISLVRSNPNGEIGFLSDVRRMNVAMTRAQKKLVVVGDSATLASHKFYAAFLDYIDTVGGYDSAWNH